MIDEALAALALRHADAVLARSRGIVRENLSILTRWMETEPRLSWVRPQAGTTALIHWDYPVESYDFCLAMYRQTGAFVTPGDCFGEPRSMRVGYACDTGELRDSLAAVSAFLRT